jgi:hypothetical protein
MQPLGVKIWAVILVLIGGFLSLVTILEIFDSVRFYGFQSIFISNLESLIGFIIYGVTPILFYVTGIGLLQRHPRARFIAVSFIPFFLFLFIGNLALHFAATFARRGMPSQELMTLRGVLFLKCFLFYLLIVLPLITYLSRKDIKKYFLPEQSLF